MDGELSEQEKLTVLHAASSRLIDLLADDPAVQKLSRAFPDEITRTFLAGCQAGADSALRVLELHVDDLGILIAIYATFALDVFSTFTSFLGTSGGPAAAGPPRSPLAADRGPARAAALVNPPETEGELYDRLRALIAECEALAGAVDEQTLTWLRSAQVHLRGALQTWMSQP